MLLLVRHAEAMTRVVGGPNELERPLTANGRRQAELLVAALSDFDITGIVSSPYRRAVETVAPLASALGVTVDLDEALHEWDDGFATTPDWLPKYRQCWDDPDHRHGDGETHRELTTRATTTIHRLLARSSDRCIVAAGHGTWIARGLQGLGIAYPYERWTTMPNPAIFKIASDGHRLSTTVPGLTA
jgi:2,3-bisphosphoglycerate-dependent phosphoglycerate mutase